MVYHPPPRIEYRSFCLEATSDELRCTLSVSNAGRSDFDATILPQYSMEAAWHDLMYLLQYGRCTFVLCSQCSAQTGVMTYRGPGAKR